MEFKKVVAQVVSFIVREFGGMIEEVGRGMAELGIKGSGAMMDMGQQISGAVGGMVASASKDLREFDKEIQEPVTTLKDVGDAFKEIPKIINDSIGDTKGAFDPMLAELGKVRDEADKGLQLKLADVADGQGDTKARIQKRIDDIKAENEAVVAAEAKIAAEESARKAAEAAKKKEETDAGNFDGLSEEEQAMRLEALNNFAIKEREQVAINDALMQEQIATARASGLISEAEGDAAKKQLAKDTADSLIAIDRTRGDQARATASQIFTDLASLQNSGSKKAFKVGKAAALAGAAVDAYSSANRVFLETPGLLPLRIAAAGAALTAGLVNVKKISSMQIGGGGGGGKSGGGGGGSASAAAAPAAAPATPPPGITAHISGIDQSQQYSGSGVEDLFNALNGGLADGRQITGFNLT